MDYSHTRMKDPDIVLQVGQRCFEVNRKTLTLFSDYFQVLFFGGMKESMESHIVLRGVDTEAFQSLLDFAVKGNLTVTTQNVTSLLEAADFLQFDKVKLLCTKFLERELDVCNCLGLHAYAQRFGCLDLGRAARNVALTHLTELTSQEEFYQLSKAALVDLLGSDRLYAPTEDVVFEAVMKWVTYELNREEESLELTGLVRVPFLSLSFLDLLVKQSQSSAVNEGYTRILKSLNRNPPPNWTLGMSACPSRRHCESLYVLGGQHNREQQELFQFHPKCSTWQRRSPLPCRNLTQYAVATVVEPKDIRDSDGDEQKGNFLVVTGGYFRDQLVWYCVDWVLMYNLWENKWQPGPPLKQARTWHCATGLGPHLYVLGGSTETTTIPEVERLTMQGSEWERLPPMSQAVERAAVVSAGNKIYVLCGLDENGHVYGGVQRLNMDLGVWDVVSFSPHPRYDLCATVLHGAVYVVGGQTFRLDVEMDEWHLVEKEGLQQFFSGCATVNGKVFLVGERKGNTAIPNMLVFDPYTDSCQIVDSAVPCPLPIRGCLATQVLT